MADPFLGEIRLFAGNFAPSGWAMCDGRTLQISQNEALYNLIGTTYGGDGQTTFALPDLRGRVPIHAGGGFSVGQNGGSESVTIENNSMPAHTHSVNGSANAATATSPAGDVPASITGGGTTRAYGHAPPFHTIDPSSIGPNGGSLPHPNIQPYRCLTFIVALSGEWPSQ